MIFQHSTENDQLVWESKLCSNHKIMDFKCDATAKQVRKLRLVMRCEKAYFYGYFITWFRFKKVL